MADTVGLLKNLDWQLPLLEQLCPAEFKDGALGLMDEDELGRDNLGEKVLWWLLDRLDQDDRYGFLEGIEFMIDCMEMAASDEIVSAITDELRSALESEEYSWFPDPVTRRAPVGSDCYIS